MADVSTSFDICQVLSGQNNAACGCHFETQRAQTQRARLPCLAENATTEMRGTKENSGRGGIKW